VRERREPCELCGTGTYADVGYSGISVCDHCGAEWTYIEGYSPSTNQFSKTRAEVAALKADLIAAQGYRAAAEEIARQRGEMVDALIVERHALAAEVAALKANDPLAKMWATLAEYQPQADADGHGHSWARMCAERKAAAASTASVAAGGAAAWACAVASDAARDAARAAAYAISAIRKAKEAKP
jgi:hypothetical protein